MMIKCLCERQKGVWWFDRDDIIDIDDIDDDIEDIEDIGDVGDIEDIDFNSIFIVFLWHFDQLNMHVVTSLLRCRVFKSDLIVLLQSDHLHLISDEDTDKTEIHKTP